MAAKRRRRRKKRKGLGQLGAKAASVLEVCPRLFQEIYGGQYEVRHVGKKLDPKRPTATPLPVLESGAVSKNANRRGQLTALRATSLGVLDACPREWHARYVLGEGQAPSRAGNLGTVVHEIIEAFMRGQLFLEDAERCRQIDHKLLELGMPIHEAQNLWTYLWHCKDDLPHVLAVELEFTLNVVEGALPLRGHMDLVLKRPEGLVIVDHKTNRRAQSLAWWQAQLQPQAYCWAVRRLWPGLPVSFRIGYVNLGKRVEWRTSPDDDAAFEARFANLWEQFVTYRQQEGPWPAKMHDNCRYCPINGRCPTFLNQGQAFIDSLGIK